MNTIIVGLLALLSGILLGYGTYNFLQVRRGKGVLQQAQAAAEQVLTEANTRAEKLMIEAQNKILQEQNEAERNAKRRRTELDREEEKLQNKRRSVDERQEKLEKREGNIKRTEQNIERRRQEIDALWEQRVEELQRISELSREQAREELLTAVEEETRTEVARRMLVIEEDLQQEADERARNIIALAIQRLASDSVSEIAVSVVPLPSDEVKGRIIGRAGRNIRAFEQATGVDVIVDDTPEAVTLSSYDPVRREVAKRTLGKLVLDGRIHPARIERLVHETRREVDRVVREEGERAAYDANVTGIHPELIKILGRLKFRSSYGQNQLSHAIETANLAGMIAAELGADVAIARMGGLLHDIGKAIDHEIEGSHAIIGAEFAKRFKVNAKVINCIASHHHEEEQTCIESIIVEAADAISGARPGARRESVDGYIKRVKTLEEIAESFQGVDHSYALQAGREVRILVRPEEVDDLGSIKLARDIANRIEETMNYPGQIKVTIIRETRVTDFAK